MSHTGHPSPSLTHFDYIVVGGGTAGPVIARRLADADPTAQVVLIEAGPSHEGIINSQMAMGWQGIHGSTYDWGYNTTPQKHANNRVINVPRGKFLGGCSGVNGMLIIRGPKADYDRWADAGCTGWAWDDVLPYFKKSETFHPTPELPSTPYHGSSGPLHTTVHPFAPISADILQSYQDKGFDYKPDMFVEGEGEGVGHAVRTVHNGIRTTSADFVSAPTVPHNLTVLTSTTALRVLLSRTSPTTPPRAVAVEVEVDNTFHSHVPAQSEDNSIDIDMETEGESHNMDADANPNMTTNTRRKIVLHARREIVLSAGAYNSPVLLMHSGIGPRQHLNDVGLDCAVDLQGVGANLQDHMIVFNFYELNKPHLTNDHLVYPPGTAEIAFKQWMEDKTGVMSRFPFGPFAYKRMNDIMKDTSEWKEAQLVTGLDDPTGQLPTQPHIEYFSTELYGGGPQFQDLPTLPTHSAFAMITMLCGPQSRGTVRLSSSSPHAPPLIDHAYLTSPLDVALLAEGARFAHEVATEGRATKDHVVGAWPASGPALPRDAQGWREYVKARAGTCYHPAGTCKMGPDGDEWAVVDERLRVRGVIGLRVADVSIMPWVNNGHTQAPAYMIGEKCATLILEDHAIAQHQLTSRYSSFDLGLGLPASASSTPGRRASNQG